MIGRHPKFPEIVAVGDETLDGMTLNECHLTVLSSGHSKIAARIKSIALR